MWRLQLVGLVELSLSGRSPLHLRHLRAALAPAELLLGLTRVDSKVAHLVYHHFDALCFVVIFILDSRSLLSFELGQFRTGPLQGVYLIAQILRQFKIFDYDCLLFL